MSLNIKSEQTHQLVQQLAQLTGETQTGAVASAVREKLARLQQRGRMSLAEQLVGIGQEISLRLNEPVKSLDHADMLYDEDGLPS